MKPNWYRYLESLAMELDSQSRRVRDLIGDRHWLSDGHHKEYLLLGLLRRHLPSSVIASRGFVVSPDRPEEISQEQDILIVDASVEAPIFRQGELMIAFPRQVMAAVSVKTTLGKREFIDSIDGLNSVRRVSASRTSPHDIWCGAFFFEVSKTVSRNPSIAIDYLTEGANKGPMGQHPIEQTPSPLAPDLYCSSASIAIKLSHAYFSDQKTIVPAKASAYDCQGLATALFLAELLDHLALRQGATDSDFAGFSDLSEITLVNGSTREIPTR